MSLQRVDVRNFLEQFRFGSYFSLSAAGGYLQMKMADPDNINRAILKFVASLHKQRGDLNPCNSSFVNLT